MALVDDIAYDCKARKEDVQNVLDDFFSILADTLVDMDTLIIPGFGQFEAKKRKERVTVHPATGRRLLVPPKIVVGFKPSGVLKSKLK
ncbi:MAG: HU family DNA-binding protein [Bacteroides sp.]|nr:HU family DNA-binding protein [Bacteroides sp.]MDE7463162.1 HU family DNA-binding protein [Muribaculaceae bacterium]